MKDFINKILDQPSTSSQPTFKFLPQIKFSPKSTLHLQIQPKDPHTASNIVINAYVSKLNRSIVPVRIQWSRYKLKSDQQYTIQKINGITGNTYMCEPSDLGVMIQVKVKSIDPIITGEAEATIGPIRIDPMLKRLIDGALYNQSLLSQVVVVQGQDKLNVNLRLYKNIMEFTEINSQQKLIMPYTFSEPKLQLSPKDPCKVYFRFQQDTSNNVRNWLNKLTSKKETIKNMSMNESSMSIKVPHSNISSGTSAKSRLFQKSHTHCTNKLQIRFLSRHSRDLLLFTLRAFICKQDMQNSVILQRIQTLQTLKSQQDYNKFLQYISLKSQIIRLAEIAKELQSDRDSKLKDISDMEQSIAEMTLTYLKIIEEKSQQQHVDLEQSYSMISMKREEILGRKNLRVLQKENQSLKNHIRELNQQIELQKFFKKDDNESMLFNQTANPFLKKSNISGIMDHNQSATYYLAGQQIKMSDPSHKNMLQISKSYLKVLQQNQKLKLKSSHKNANNQSRDIENLLQSLHESEQQDRRIADMRNMIDGLKNQITRLSEINKQLLKQNNDLKNKRIESNIIIQNQSYNNNTPQKLQYSNIGHSQVYSNSMISNSYISMNQSMTSQAELSLLQKKLIELASINSKFETENTRLRKQRDYFRSLYEKQLVKNKMIVVTKVEETSGKIQQQQIKSKNNVVDGSNLLLCDNDRDRDNNNSMIIKLEDDKQRLENEKNSLLKKIDSLIRQSQTLTMKVDNHQIINNKYKQVMKIKENLQEQVEKLKKTIQNMRQFHELEKRQLLQNNNTTAVTMRQGMTQQQQPIQELQRLKKANTSLLMQIKQLRMQLQRKSDPDIKSSRIIELENQLDIFKTYTQQREAAIMLGIQSQNNIDEIVKQLTQFRKENQRLKEYINTLELKINTQSKTIEKLMIELDEIHRTQQKNSASAIENSFNLKYLSTPDTPDKQSQLGQLEKYRKKVSDLEAELEILRRNSQAVNRSRDLSMSMMGYEQERLEIYKKENQSLMFEIQNLNKMCSKYSRDAREANLQLNKLRQKINNMTKEKFQLSC